MSTDRLEPAVHRRPIGRLLVEMGALSMDDLEQLLAVQRHDGGLLGEIAVGRGLASPLILLSALKKQQALPARPRRRGSDRRPAAWRPLGQVLVERRLITTVQLRQALADQALDGGFLGEVLLDRGWITVRALVEALSEQIVEATSPGTAFVVREYDAGGCTSLYTAASFADATDFVFDDVLLRREPQRLEIVHCRGGREEVAWSYEPPRPAPPSRTSKLIEALRLISNEPAATS